MAKIQFKDLGRDKFSEAIQISNGLSAQEVAKIAYEEARKHLISGDVNSVYDSNKNEGLIYAGFRIAGTFSVVA